MEERGVLTDRLRSTSSSRENSSRKSLRMHTLRSPALSHLAASSESACLAASRPIDGSATRTPFRAQFFPYRARHRMRSIYQPTAAHSRQAPLVALCTGRRRIFSYRVADSLDAHTPHPVGPETHGPMPCSDESMRYTRVCWPMYQNITFYGCDLATSDYTFCMAHRAVTSKTSVTSIATHCATSISINARTTTAPCASARSSCESPSGSSLSMRRG